MRIVMANNKEIKVYNGEIWGVKISPYAIEHMKLDYKSMISALTFNEYFPNNTIISAVQDWDLFNGEDYNEETDEYYDVLGFYVISERAAKNLQRYTDEIVYYSPSLDLYLLGVCHYGTSWDYVLTEYEIMGE